MYSISSATLWIMLLVLSSEPSGRSAGADRQLMRIRDLIRGRHPRAECAGRQFFPTYKTSCAASRAPEPSVMAAVAGSVAQRLLATDVFAAAR